MTKFALQRRAQELAAEQQTKEAHFKAGQISKAEYKAFVDRAHEEAAEIKSDLKAYEQATKFSWGTEANIPASQLAPADGGRIMAPSPMDMTPQQVNGLLQAAEHRTPYSIEIAPKAFRFRDSVTTKAGAVTESGLGGSFGGQLPPVQSLYAVGLGYEPVRLADLFPGAAMPGPSATFLTHTSNSAAAGIVPEAGTKGDIGPSISETQVIPSKIAAQVSVTLEAWQDTDRYGPGQFSQWLPTELTRAIIDAESNAAANAVNGTANATFNGVLNVSGTLTRAMGADSPLDCLAKAFADVRVGSAFADPDLVLMHPNTLSALRRAKDAEGRYLLELISGPSNLTAYGQPFTAGPAREPNPYSVIPQSVPGSNGNLWGATIFATTHVAAGKAVVMSVKAGAGIWWQRLGMLIMFDPYTLLSTNEYRWICEERVAFNSPRPTAINIVTGLPTS
jgi:hypothetical protein